MPTTAQPFGQMPDGAPVTLFTLTNAHRLTAKVTNYGGHLVELHVPDRHGHPANIILGFDSLAGYLGKHPYFGSTVGRVANRINGGRFALDGKHYQLACNDHGNHHLHGGVGGFSRQLFRATPSDNAVRLDLFSHDGAEGYPGNLSVTVTYTLTDNSELRIDYTATTDAATPVNLTNHAYFNFAGAGARPVYDHRLLIAADRYTPVSDDLIPTGAVADVSDTPLDFRSFAEIGARIADIAPGYDHNFRLNHAPGQIALAAEVFHPDTGRVMTIETDQPAIQLYTGNFLDGSDIGIGGPYHKHAAFCLETQHDPDSPNQPGFPSIILRPGATYRTSTIHRFSTR